MVKATITTDLSLAITALERLQPYSTHPDSRIWKAVLLNFHGIESMLLTMEAFAPGKLRLIEAAAMEEFHVVHSDPIPEITNLVDRYSARRERLR